MEVSGHLVVIDDLLNTGFEEGVDGLAVLRHLDPAFVAEQDETVTASTDGFEQVGGRLANSFVELAEHAECHGDGEESFEAERIGNAYGEVHFKAR